MALGRLLNSDNDQHDPSHQQQSSHEWRQRQDLINLSNGLHGSKIDKLLAACVSDAWVEKRRDSKEDQGYADLDYRFSIHL